MKWEETEKHYRKPDWTVVLISWCVGFLIAWLIIDVIIGADNIIDWVEVW